MSIAIYLIKVKPVRRADAWEDLGSIPADAVLLSVHGLGTRARFHQRRRRVVVGIQRGSSEVLVGQTGQGSIRRLNCYVGVFQLPV